MAPTVDIGVACSSSQSPDWWVPLIANLLAEQRDAGIEIGRVLGVASALPDHNKNYTVGYGAYQEQKRRYELTDANRNKLTGRFMDGKSEWLFQIDDDTVPPKGALSQLLSLGREFVAGLYFLPKPPHNPIAYIRDADGLYHAFWNYPLGAMVQVDSVGMGCTLIHRSVFEKIVDGHEVLQRPNGALIAFPTDRISGPVPEKWEPGKEYVKKGVLHTPVYRVTPEDNRPYPFYLMEHGRTEDHYFCELANNVGIRPWLDTTVECQHFKLNGVGRKEYRESLARSHDGH